MSIQSIGPPPLTKNQDSSLDRWLQLFWNNQASNSPTGGDSVIADKIFLQHQSVIYTNLVASDSTTILAGQIFGS